MENETSIMEHHLNHQLYERIGLVHHLIGHYICFMKNETYQDISSRLSNQNINFIWLSNRMHLQNTLCHLLLLTHLLAVLISTSLSLLPPQMAPKSFSRAPETPASVSTKAPVNRKPPPAGLKPPQISPVTLLPPQSPHTRKKLAI